MTDTPTRRRMTRTQRAQHLYTARADEYQSQPYNEEAYQPNEEPSSYAAYQPNEYEQEYGAYEPNEPQEDDNGYLPNEKNAVSHYAAYYSRESQQQDETVQPAFAPPPSMQQYAMDFQPQESEEPEEAYSYAANHVYRPRQVTWAEEELPEAEDESGYGYQVAEEYAPVRPQKRHPLRIILIILLILALAGGAVWALRDHLGLGQSDEEPAAEPAAAMMTPAPVKAYEAAPAAAMSDAARKNIAQLSGTLEMEQYLVTEQHVITRNKRADGRYDFYLFTAEGRLLCYFEGLSAQDMMPQAFGSFYVNQAPWLITASGSALVRTTSVEAAIGESVFLHPMYHGWAVVESDVDGQANYVNADGQLLSTLWFSRTFPFTGSHTLAYVDTGSTAAAEQRYLLYVLDENGGMNRWFAADDMNDVLSAVCGVAYMKDGTFYHLSDTEAPAGQSPDITAYLNCDALVVKDSSSGKYGLFVRGKQHYDFVYDAIKPVQSELAWTEHVTETGAAKVTLKAVAVNEAQPLSFSFVLEKDGKSEYVALSATSSYPIRLDGEF